MHSVLRKKFPLSLRNVRHGILQQSLAQSDTCFVRMPIQRISERIETENGVVSADTEAASEGHDMTALLIVCLTIILSTYSL
jgi:hypothetical protein